MSNTILTLGSGAITRKALSILHNNLIFCRAIDKQYDDRFAVRGAKIGDTLDIRLPNQFAIRTGSVMDAQDVTENMHELTLGTQRGVDINFSSAELLLDMDDFAERILDPAMARLASEMESIILTGCYRLVGNHVLGTKGSAPTYANMMSARSLLSKALAPSGNRVVLMDSLGTNGVITDSKSLYAPSSEIARQYSKGLVGTVAGFNFFESEMIPTHTQGTYADTDAGTVDVATEFVNDETEIVIDSCTDTGTMTVGQVFTVAGVYDVNPETKAVYKHLKQWVVRATSTASGGSMAHCYISPTIQISGVKQNCSITANASAAVLTETVGGSGTLSTGYPQNMAFHKNAFAMVTGDLEVPKGVDFAAREVYDGISLRIVRKYDIVNDKFPCRIDVFFGYTAPRPEWACRLSG